MKELLLAIAQGILMMCAVLTMALLVGIGFTAGAVKVLKGNGFVIALAPIEVVKK